MLQGSTVKSSTYTLQDLKDELHEDWESAITRNMETFEGKFALYQRQLQDELSRVMRDESSRVIDELNKGPHDKIKNQVRTGRFALKRAYDNLCDLLQELREIWKEMVSMSRASPE